MTAAGAALDMGALAEHVARRRAMFYPKADIVLDDAVLRTLAAHPAEELREEAGQALAAALGDAATEYRLTPMPQQGTYHRVYLASGAEGSRRYVVRLNRLPREERDWQLLADESVSRALAQQGIDHPEVVLVDCSRAQAATDFEVAEFIEAPTLSAFDADDARIAPWLARAARMLARVHAVRGQRYGFIDVSGTPTLVGVHASWVAFLRARLAENITQVTQAGLLTAAERGVVEAHFEDGFATLGAVEPRLLHGDPGNHNILARADGTVVFIDWEDALLGDPHFDLAFWATFHPERRWPAFFAAYFGAPWVPDARFWLYYLRIAISKTVHRLRFDYADHPDRPRASLRMQRALQALGAAA